MKLNRVVLEVIAAGLILSGSMIAQNVIPSGVANASGTSAVTGSESSAAAAKPTNAAEVSSPSAATEAKPETKPAAAKTDKAPAKPKPRFEFTYEERIRSESWNNIQDFNNKTDDKRGNERFRTRFTINTAINENVDVNVRMTNEFRNYRMPEVAYDYDEVFFDNLYVDFKKTPVKGLALRIGRQDIVKGEGLLFSDPSGPDGSRGSYTNAAVFTYSFPKRKAKLELLGILNPRRERFLPTVGTAQPVTWLAVNPVGGAAYKEENRQLQESDTQAVGLYYTDKNHKNFDLETYYFLMHELHDARAVSAANFMPDRHFHTVGGRIVSRVSKSVTVASEVTGEFGSQHAAGLTKPAATVRGWAAYIWAQKNFDAKWKPYLKAGYYGLSGDDPLTKGTNEGFDPMFARTTKFNELPFYAGSKERGLGFAQNMFMPQFEGGVTPFKMLTVKATYQYMKAFQPYAGAAAVFGKGTTRGSDYSVKAEVTPNKYIKSHFVYEHMAPGNFYSGTTPGWFLRAEIMYTYKYSFLTLHKKQ